MRAPGPAQIDLVDSLGRLVRQRRVALPVGAARIDLDLGGLAPGVYVVRATAAGGIGHAPVTVVR